MTRCELLAFFVGLVFGALVGICWADMEWIRGLKKRGALVSKGGVWFWKGTKDRFL